MASLLDFVERVRTLQDLPLVGAISLSDAVVDDEERCVLALALGCRVGGVETSEGEWPMAMHFPDRLLARRIGIVMGLPWSATPPAVRLPDAIADVAVSHHFGLTEAGELGFLRGWWVPVDEDDGELAFFTPHDELLPDGDWLLPSQSRRGRT